MKECPVCKKILSSEDFYQYFSKARQKYRKSNYCKVCARTESNKRAKKNYIKNHEKKLAYAKHYRQQNAEKIKNNRPKYKRKQREELQDCYVSELLVYRNGFKRETIKQMPIIIEVHRSKLKVNRKLKALKNDEK